MSSYKAAADLLVEVSGKIAKIIGHSRIKVATSKGSPVGESFFFNKTDRQGMDFTIWTVNEAGVYNGWIATFSLTQLPGCCGVMVSHYAAVQADYRGKGIGRLLNQLRQDMARALGYTILLCTDVVNNEAQRRILATEGWQDLLTFTNRRTSNTVALSAIDLTLPKP